jgi:hypothetical protein
MKRMQCARREITSHGQASLGRAGTFRPGQGMTSKVRGLEGIIRQSNGVYSFIGSGDPRS